MLESSRAHLKDVKSFKKSVVFIRNLGNGGSESAKIQFNFDIENKNLHGSGVGRMKIIKDVKFDASGRIRIL